MDYGKNNKNSNTNKAPITISEKKKEFERILDNYLESNPMMKRDHKTSELEIRFGTNTRLSKPLSKIDYDNVVKQLFACGFKTQNMDGIQILRINNEYIDMRSGMTKMSNIRADIIGTDMIREYCRTNSIQKLIDMPSTKYNKLKFTKKMTALTKSGEFIKILDMDDFNFRVSYQTEQDFTIQSNVSRDIISKWVDSKKTFRCLNRVRLSHPDYPIFADLSIIKSSKKTNYVPIPQYTIQEANVFNNIESYQVELEIDNMRVGTGTPYNTAAKLMDVLRKSIRIVLCGLQGTKYPISYIEKDNILRSYMRLIHQDYEEEKDDDDDEESGEYESSSSPPPESVFKQLSQLEEGELREGGSKRNIPNDRDWKNRRVRTKDFIGPSSFTLQIENIQPIQEDSNIINIQKNYTITDKADGERKLLYINPDGKIYLIDTNMNVIFTGTKTNEKTIYNSLLDGEHIKTDKNNNPIHLYAAFDIYFVNKKSIREYLFYPDGTENDEQKEDTKKQDKNQININCNTKDATMLKYRLPLLDCFVDLIKPVSILESQKETGEVKSNMVKNATEFRIQRKTFYATSPTTSIFDGCAEILSKMKDGLFEYNTDGLIFTPTNLAVGAEHIGGKCGPIMKSTWRYSFKWKPAEFNTIDFLVSVKKDKNGKEEIHNVFQDGRNLQGVQDMVQYKTLILRCGFNERTDGYINPFQDMINDVIPESNDVDNEDLYKPVPFQPTDPYDPNACFCNIALKIDGSNLLMMTEENEYFEENMIVEFKYNIENEDGWKWQPLRVRYDKTAELNSGQKNYGNAYRVANNNWHSIHNPVTEEMISTGKNIPELSLSTDVYYNRSTEETSTQSMRDFHNLFVKKNLILAVSSRGDNLIDYAVGKAGDMSKWTMGKLKFVFGIDISRDNIHNRIDGACARYLTARKKQPNMLHALFVNGDSKFNIRSGEAFLTEKDKQIANAVFGVGAKDVTKLGKGVYNEYGVAESGFNISSCQFALHYFFENKTVFHQFLRNIAECTKLGGYFIGTCYDGKKVFQLLRNKENGEGVSIIKNERKIFEITKRYDETGFPDEDLSLGYAIDVYQESINQVFREYLVNFDYLKRIMEDYGFVLSTKEEAQNMNLLDGTGMFEDMFHSMELEVKINPRRKSDYRKAVYMSSEEQTISFLNRYFVFKKVRSVDVKKMSNIILKQTVMAEKFGEENMMELEKSIKKKTIKNKDVVIVRKIKNKKIVLKTFVPISETSPIIEEPEPEPEVVPEPVQEPEVVPEPAPEVVPEPAPVTQKELPKVEVVKKARKRKALPFDCDTDYQTKDKDKARMAELNKLNGQQLRDILSNLKQEPTGQKSTTEAKTKGDIIKLIICIENENK